MQGPLQSKTLGTATAEWHTQPFRAHGATEQGAPVPRCAAPSFQYKAQCRWPHSSPISASPSGLARMPRNLALLLLPCGARAWHLPLTVPGFCLPEGSPATRKSQPRGWVCPISQICLQDWHKEHPVPPQQTPPGPPPITIISSEPSSSQERGRRQTGSWLRGGKVNISGPDVLSRACGSTHRDVS